VPIAELIAPSIAAALALPVIEESKVGIIIKSARAPGASATPTSIIHAAPMTATLIRSPADANPLVLLIVCLLGAPRSISVTVFGDLKVTAGNFLGKSGVAQEIEAADGGFAQDLVLELNRYST